MIHLKKTVGYVSEIDQLLTKFDQSTQLSPAQLAEKKKYERINQLRDNTQTQKNKE